MNIFNQSVTLYILTKISTKDYNNIKKIINDDIYIKYHKKHKIFEILKPLIQKNVITILNPKILNKNIKNKNCFNIKDKSKCIFPCSLNETNDCRLYLKDEKKLDEFIYKYIELLIINGIDNIKNIINYRIENHELEKTINPEELFFTFIMLKDNLDDYLNFIFNKNKHYEEEVYNSKLFENKNIFNNNLLKYLDNSPLIIRKMFGKNTKLINYNISETDILNKLNITLSDSQKKEKYELEDYKKISKEKDILFLLITKKYSKDLINYNLHLIDNKKTKEKLLNNDLYILFHKKNSDEDYDLCLVSINEEIKHTFEKISNNPNFKNYIKNNNYLNFKNLID